MKKNYLLLIVLVALTSAIKAQAQEPYIAFNDENKTATFYYDTQKAERNGLDLGTSLSDLGVRTVEFDASFADCTSITNTSFWFMGCSKMSEIKGLQYLNTENVTEMTDMFNNCSKLTSLDLSTFKTDKLENMSGMFWGCYKLESLNMSSFNTANVTNMMGVFAQCPLLANLDITNFNTEKVTCMNFMFNGCEKLETLDLSSFNTANVSEMFSMFAGCSNLTTIYVGDGWSMEKALGEGGMTFNMFGGCDKLAGGSAFNSDITDGTGASTAGYLTKKDDATAIQRLTATSRTATAIYTLSGQRLTTPHKGINIINGKKVIVK